MKAWREKGEVEPKMMEREAKSLRPGLHALLGRLTSHASVGQELGGDGHLRRGPAVLSMFSMKSTLTLSFILPLGSGIFFILTDLFGSAGMDKEMDSDQTSSTMSGRGGAWLTQLLEL